MTDTDPAVTLTATIPEEQMPTVRRFAKPFVLITVAMRRRAPYIWARRAARRLRRQEVPRYAN